MNFVKCFSIYLLLWVSTALAGSMNFFPSTWDLWMYCVYSGEIRVDTTPDAVSAIDTRIFTTNIELTWFTGLLSLGSYTHLWRLGHSLMTVNYPRQSYASNSAYYYLNRYASDADHLLNVSDTALFSYLFSSTWLVTTWNLDLYYIAGENFDDSNMQSNIINGMADVLDEVNSGSYDFLPRPCIDDIDMPIFTWYISGASYTPDTIDSGLSFTITDFTGNHIVGNNNTEHYRFQSWTPDTGNLANYVAVSSGSGIDNQEGVNSGTIMVSLSWISNITSWNLLAPVTFMLSGLDCGLTYAGPWNPLTWNRETRWYTCLLSLTGLTFESSQIIQVIITGSDNINFNGETHTGSIAFTISYIQSWTYFDVITFPGSRPGGDFSNLGTLKFYNPSKTLVASIPVNTNSSWFSGAVEVNGLSNDTYYVVYKWQSHLASYLSGVFITAWGLFTLDFTTWTNLFNTQNKSISQNDGYQYQIAGDLLNGSWQYDYQVNWSDISILIKSGFIDYGISVLDPKNLNGDTAINVSDISVIGTNVLREDPFLVDWWMFVW